MARANLNDQIFNISKLRAATDKLEQYGVEPELALRNTGLTIAELKRSESLISIHQLMVAFSNISRARISPTLAFEIGRLVHVSAYGLYGYALLCSKDFRRSMSFAEKYQPLALPVCDIHFTFEPMNEGWIFKPIEHPLMDEDLYAFVTNFQFGVHTAVHCDVMGAHFKADGFQVEYGRDQYYQLPESCSPLLRHRAKESKMFIGAHWLDQTPELGNDVTFDQFEKLCQNELADIAVHTGVSGRIRTEILRNMAAPLNIDELAQKLGVTSRTLRRQLRSEGTSYRDLLNQIRLELATRYVEDREMTNDDIAFALGFSDAGSFRKAFRRWTGQTASDFRSQSGTQGD
ncbi:helix-turn-helix domain-containing protein [Actibacterium sp.]|uniref:helix-turn-helix domain-containing protein n=1 Tax=Actibacterium sp. TaxID=1872125 RepID=UPI003566DB18